MTKTSTSVGKIDELIASWRKLQTSTPLEAFVHANRVLIQQTVEALTSIKQIDDAARLSTVGYVAKLCPSQKADMDNNEV